MVSFRVIAPRSVDFPPGRSRPDVRRCTHFGSLTIIVAGKRSLAPITFSHHPAASCATALSPSYNRPRSLSEPISWLNAQQYCRYRFTPRPFPFFAFHLALCLEN